ncbi:hypothetical protein PybrP1_010077 [[Pythium] brassicae (nom. inval.)]|nr:hypothetical protein PybrP1_010077 [[Pythium] brassicae (nom. inval.)]
MLAGLLRRPARLAATAPALSSLRAASSSATVGGALEAAVARLPHKEALRSVKQETRWSFKELNAIVDELAFGLHAMRFAPNDVLAVWLPNSSENWIAQLGAAKAGVTVAIIDPKVSTAEELAFILRDCKANALLFEPKIAGRDQTAIVQSVFPELETYRYHHALFRPKHFRSMHTVITTGIEPVEGMAHFHQFMMNSPEKNVIAALKKAATPTTPLTVTYSSASSALVASLKLSPEDKILITGEETPLPVALLAAIETSALVVLPSSEFDSAAVQHALKVEPCSIVGSGASNYQRV